MVIDGLADQTVLLPTFHEHRKGWEAVVDASEGCWIPVDVPYESTGAAEALARGWNAFLFDGPGQQSMLFERNVPFRYD
jgi:hypothetical protein